MYWQVYLHKTSLVAELLLERLLKHARILTSKGEVLKTSNSLSYFLNRVSNDINSLDLLKRFALLDDYDIVQIAADMEDAIIKDVLQFLGVVPKVVDKVSDSNNQV